MIRTLGNDRPVIGKRAYVDDLASVIGDVVLGDDVSVWPSAVLRGDVHRIRIGARSNVQDNAVIHVTHDGPYSQGGHACLVGDDVTIGHGAIVHGCTIHDACLIGMGALVLDGAEVGPFAIVGAGAVVTAGKKVGEGELWVGNPARCVRCLSDRERDQLLYSAHHYVDVKNRYLVPSAS